jgi:hypothetical protein
MRRNVRDIGKNAHELPVTPKNEKTGGDKPRPYRGYRDSLQTVGAGFTPARNFQENINDMSVTPNNENGDAGDRGGTACRAPACCRPPKNIEGPPPFVKGD